MKTKVLIFTGYFTPSIKAGGPVQSIKNLVDNLSNEIDFYIVTSDRDLGDETPFSNLETEKWISKENSNIYYSNVSNLNFHTIKKIISIINPDYLYLNSLFSKKFSIQLILMKKIRMIDNIPIVITPRGELSKGALSLKSLKKRLYLFLSKCFHLYDSVTWQATTYSEKQDILKVFKKAKEVKIANNLTENYNQVSFEKNVIKEPGELKLIFLSRIHPTKNLKKCLELLNYVNGKVVFNIYGPIEDDKYWSECLDLINNLNSQIFVNWYGPVEHTDIMEKMNNNHVFILPTLGENYGHVISEALIGGCPVIISDQTPWRKLEDIGVGWDIELYNKRKYISSLQYCIDMNQDEYNQISKQAFDYAKMSSNSPEDIKRHVSLFT